MKVTIFGGSGFVGRTLSERLMQRGYQVRVVSRSGKPCTPGVEGMQADPHDERQRLKAMRSQDAVINLVGILHGDEWDFRRAHIELGEKIAASCHEAGVSILLHMSALHADPQGPSRYLRSKGVAEDRVHAIAGDDLRVTSLRPSVIFGAGDNFLNRFAALLKFAPGVMMLPGAQARFAPVFVGDVAEAFVRALEDASLAGQRIDLCGPKDYTLMELVRLTARWSGHPRLILPMPGVMAQAMAMLMERLPEPPLTRDNLASMSINSICPPGSPRQPTALEDIAPGYLGR